MGIEFQWTESWFRSGATTVQPESDVAQTLFTDGTAAAPSRAYIDDTNVGSYRIGADNEGFSAGGTLRWDYNTARINLSSGYTLQLNTVGALSLSGANNRVQVGPGDVPVKVGIAANSVAAAAAEDGGVMIATVDDTLIYYSDGARYKVVGVAF